MHTASKSEATSAESCRKEMILPLWKDHLMVNAARADRRGVAPATSQMLSYFGALKESGKGRWWWANGV